MTLELVPDTNGHLSAWAATFADVATVAASLATTPFVPVNMRVITSGRYDAGATAANVAAAILTGQELGLGPMASLRSIDVINATPALRAIALRALVQSHGHRITVEEATSTRAVVAGLRAGEDESRTVRITWTMDDARSRNLAGKPNWRTQPRNMLIARATAEVARLIAADAIVGIPYTAEELEDGDSAPPEDNTPPPVRRTARRRQVAELEPKTEPEPAPVEDEPPTEDAPPPPQPVDEPVSDRPHLAPITAGQRRALHAGFRALDMDRKERLEVVSRIVDRNIESANDLSEAEASAVITEVTLRRARKAQEVARAASERFEGEPAPDVPEPQETKLFDLALEQFPGAVEDVPPL